MRTCHVAILTIKDDIHALAIQKALEGRDDITCDVVETNGICNSGGLTWAIGNYSYSDNAECGLPTRTGKLLDVRQLDVIWLRRINYPQNVPGYISDPDVLNSINRDCRTALSGLLINEFSGMWINHPLASHWAENKLIQLHAARSAGFRIPHTIVSQDPARIKKFCATHHNNVVVKTVAGSSTRPLCTIMMTDEVLASEEALLLSPAVYQEYIPGYQHIRAHCFGDAVYTVLIETQELDWRLNLRVPFKIVELDSEVKERLRKVLTTLGLKMGVFDLKLDTDSTLVWLEVNPQGQFLFAEALTGLELISAFSNWLYEEARRAALNRD